MIDPEAFTTGMQGIAAGVRKVWEGESLGVYFDALNCQTDAPEWDSFARWANRTGRWQWLPTLREIIDALREFRGERPLLVEATEAYERVLASGSYSAEGGTSWSYRRVRERCGEAAAEAFLAAGGTSGFATTWDESKRRERFTEAYAEAVRESPATKLLPGVKALPPAEPSAGPVSREEAKRAIETFREIVGEPPTPRGPTIVKRTEERAAVLARQAADLLADEESRVAAANGPPAITPEIPTADLAGGKE